MFICNWSSKFIDIFPMLQQGKYFDGVPINFDIGIFTLESYNWKLLVFCIGKHMWIFLGISISGYLAHKNYSTVSLTDSDYDYILNAVSICWTWLEISLLQLSTWPLCQGTHFLNHISFTLFFSLPRCFLVFPISFGTF